MSPPSVKGEAEEDPARARSARSSIFLMQMKGFGKVALVFVLLGGLMAYFIIPVQFSRKRALSPADKAEYALTVNYYESQSAPKPTPARAGRTFGPASMLCCNIVVV